MLSGHERNYLRDLAKRIRELADTDRHKEIVRRYKRINSLHIERSPVALHLPDDAHIKLLETKKPIIEDQTFRWLENEFLVMIRRDRVLRADMPITNVFYTGLFHSTTDWMDEYKHVVANKDGTSSAFQPCLKSYGDLCKMRYPELAVDWKLTNQRFEEIHSTLGDILDIRIGSPFSMTCGWGESIIDQFVEMRGLEQTYMDFIDAPEFVHEVMRFMADGKLALLDQYRAQNALFINNDRYLIGSCSYPLTDELPGKMDSQHKITGSNLWAFAQAQELSEVSPDMLREFVLPYQARITNRFGLISYGCCEKIDDKIDVIEAAIPNLRILTVSPYCNVDRVAEKCRGKYVMACKMHPALVSSFSDARVEEAIRSLLHATTGCSLTITFAEIMNYGDDERIFPRIADIVCDTIDRYWAP